MTTNDQPAPAAGSADGATPLTDGHLIEVLDNDTGRVKVLDRVYASFARSLEKRLTTALADNVALREEVERLKADVSREVSVCDTACMEANDLRAQLATAQVKIAELEQDKADLDWLEEWHLSLSRLTSPDLSGLRFVGQYFNPRQDARRGGS